MSRLRKENAVLLTSQHRNHIGCGIRRHVGLESKARLLPGPANRCAGAEEIAFEVVGLRAVFNVSHIHDAVPLHVERDPGMNRKNRRDPQGGNPKSLREGIGQVVVVEDVQVADAQASVRAVKINFQGVAAHGDHPEDVIAIDVHVVVVSLLREIGRSSRTGIDVESNKGERTVVLPAVRADEFAPAEAHVGLEGQAQATRSRTAAADVGEPDEPVEVSNLRRVIDAAERFFERIVMDEGTERRERSDAPRNGVRVNAASQLLVAIVVAGVDQFGAQQAGAQRRAGSPPNKTAAAETFLLKTIP